MDKTNMNEPILTGNDILNGNYDGKQKQIEEMSKDIKKIAADWTASCEYSCDNCPYGNCRGKIATFLVNAGYRKIPENAVVLTDKKDIQQYEWSKICDKMGIFKLVEKECAKTSAETAKKFAERLKVKCEYNHKMYGCSATVGANDIDEICKEITEGKV